MGQAVFLQQICIFKVLQIFCTTPVLSQFFDRQPTHNNDNNNNNNNKNSFLDTHNSCTRKLLCLIAARNDGNSYENIRLGKLNVRFLVHDDFGESTLGQFMLMGRHQLWIALLDPDVFLVPDVSKLWISLLEKKIINENETFFICDKYFPQIICLHLMEPNFEMDNF